MKALKHFNKILTHKYYVFKNCCRYGLIWRGIKHDLSKFSPIEFFESVKYYTGTDSPINKCKKENGYSLAWQHHKGRNTHHYEYWMDNFDQGGTSIRMPYKDALEMFCDYIAAAQAYMGKNFTWEAEYEWWKKKSENCAMSVHTKKFISHCMDWGKVHKEFPPKSMVEYFYQVSLTDKEYKVLKDY